MDRYSFEFTVGGLFSWGPLDEGAEADDGGGSFGIGGGGVISLGFRHRRRFRAESPLSSSGGGLAAGFVKALFAMATLGLAAVPKVAWLGTDRGLDIKLRTMTLTDGDRTQTSIALGLSPVLRVSGRHSRWRWPAVVHFLLPELGVILRLHGRHAFYLQPVRFPVSVLLSPRLGLELEAGFWLTVPLLGNSKVDMAGTLSLTMVVR